MTTVVLERMPMGSGALSALTVVSTSSAVARRVRRRDGFRALTPLLWHEGNLCSIEAGTSRSRCDGGRMWIILRRQRFDGRKRRHPELVRGGRVGVQRRRCQFRIEHDPE
jgi:hypothetical protein